MTAGFRNSDFSADHDLSCREFAAIDILGGIVVRSKRRTLERNAGKKTSRARVTEDFRTHVGIRIRGSIASYGACRHRGITAQFHFAVENRIRASFIHYEQNEVGSFSADLESNTAAFERVHRGRTPRPSETLAGAANHCAAAIARANYERRLENGWKHDDALSLSHHFLRDAVGDIHDLLHHHATIFQPVLFFVRGIDHHREKHETHSQSNVTNHR